MTNEELNAIEAVEKTYRTQMATHRALDNTYADAQAQLTQLQQQLNEPGCSSGDPS